MAHNAFSIGRQLGLPEARLQRLYFAGLLHDVGKIGVPDSVLLKPGKLTRDEFEVMKKHSPHGYKLIAEISDSMGSIAMGIRHHHERWDGKGYPDRATGEEIHLYGRIMAVADVFEALTTRRPYRRRCPKTGPCVRSPRPRASTSTRSWWMPLKPPTRPGRYG